MGKPDPLRPPFFVCFVFGSHRLPACLLMSAVPRNGGRWAAAGHERVSEPGKPSVGRWLGSGGWLPAALHFCFFYFSGRLCFARHGTRARLARPGCRWDRALGGRGGLDATQRCALRAKRGQSLVMFSGTPGPGPTGLAPERVARAEKRPNGGQAEAAGHPRQPDRDQRIAMVFRQYSRNSGVVDRSL
jgi:hypothetical protein